MTKAKGIYYGSNADEAHVAKVSAARMEADEKNQKALEKLRPWDTEMDYYDVNETDGKMFKVTKPRMVTSSLTVYVDGKKATKVMTDGDVIAVTTKKQKAPKADPVKASKK